MSKKNRNKKRGTGGGASGNSTGSSVSSTPGIGSKRPLSQSSPEAENKRQRDESVSSMIADSVFEVTGINTRDEGSGGSVGSVGSGNTQEKVDVDKPKLTKELMEALEKFLQTDEIRVEGMGEEITGATVVMNALLRRILPFFLTFIIDKMSELYKQKDVTVGTTERTEGGRAGDLQSLCAKLKFENDRLEQYSRRESLRIFGLAEPQNGNEDEKTLERKVLKVLNDTGAKIIASDISVMHRIGKKKLNSQGQDENLNENSNENEEDGQGQNSKRGPRPVIVRFISRNKKMQVMSLKKNLQTKQGYKNIFIFEDITRLRSKLLYHIKNLPGIGRAWTKDGQIYCRKKGPDNTIQKEVIGPIENADGLFEHLGVTLTVENVDQLGLSGFVFV